jgi:tetratricopeptide (TPR) repeat protein
MFTHVKLIVPTFVIAVCSGALAQPQTPTAQTRTAGPDGSVLQERYNAAQRFQKEGNLDKAGAEYRAFLADALGELAVGYGQLGDYAKAASFFDETLALEPNSPALRLEYATVAMVLGDLPHAETLAREFLRDYPRDQNGLAQAHQILGRALLRLNKDRDARKELEAAVALNPTFENGYDLAVACLDLDDEQCAQQLFSEMQASFGDTPGIHMNFGRAYVNSDSQLRAVEEFKKVIAEDPRFPGAHYALAAALLATGDDAAKTAAAEAELKTELAISPNDSLTYAALGEIAISQHRYAEAGKYLERATILDPKSPDAFLYLGQMYVDTSRPADAEAALRKSIRLTTDVSRNRYQVQKAHYLLGRLLAQQHKQEEAHAEMQTAHTLLNKGLSEDKSKLAGLLDSTEIAGSTDASENSTAPRGIASKSADPEAVRRITAFEKHMTQAVADSYNNLGAIAASGKDYGEALTYFQHAEEWNPSLDGLDYNWGRAAFSASRFGDAIMPLSRHLRLHPEDSSVRVALGISQFMTRDYGGCLKTLQLAEKSSAAIPQVEYVYADSLVKTGQISSGMERLHSLEKLHPEIAEVHGALGDALERQGERQKAIEELHTAIGLNPNDPETHYDLGKVELEQGDAVAAISELETAIRLRPDDPHFHEELASAYRVALHPVDAENELRIYGALKASQAPSAKTAADSHGAKPR